MIDRRKIQTSGDNATMSHHEHTVVVAHASDETRDAIVASINDQHRVIATCGTVTEIKQTVLATRPDILITGVMYPDGEGIDTAIELSDAYPLPTVVATAARSLELVEKAMRDHVMAYLIEPIVPEDLEAAIIVAWSRFEQLRDLESQVEDLKLALEHRKYIERAKGILMASESMSEADAFGYLRRRAQDTRRRMIDIAHEILESRKMEG